MRKFIKVDSFNEVTMCHYMYDELSQAEKDELGEGIIVDEIPEQPSVSKTYKLFYTPEDGFTYVEHRFSNPVLDEIDTLKLMVADLALNAGGL